MRATRENIYTGMRVRDQEGSTGTIMSTEDLRNVLIVYDDPEHVTEIACFDENCPDYSLSSSPIYVHPVQ